MDVKYAVGLPTVGEFGDVAALLDVAVAAERHGWDASICGITSSTTSRPGR